MKLSFLCGSCLKHCMGVLRNYMWFLQGTDQTQSANIPILPMAFLTFAEAKVVAPPIVPMNELITFS